MENSKRTSDCFQKIQSIFFDFPSVQILVVVASIQMRNLNAEVEKDFVKR